MHFAAVGCDRLTEAPGASQEMCNNSSCGVVKWHFSQKEFQQGQNGEWEETRQKDFALVVFKTNTEELVLTERPCLGEEVRSRWVRLENSEQFEAVRIDPGIVYVFVGFER